MELLRPVLLGIQPCGVFEQVRRELLDALRGSKLVRQRDRLVEDRPRLLRHQ